MTNNPLFVQTIDDVHSLSFDKRQDILEKRGEWLNRQRKQDKAENHRIECKIARLRKKKQGDD